MDGLSNSIRKATILGTSLGRSFPIADRWFASLLRQTDPSRQYLIATSSRGLTDDIQAFLTSVPPIGTFFNMLDKYGISWKDYVADYPFRATPELYPISDTDTATEAIHHMAVDQFFTEAAAGTLPSFSFFDPNYKTQSEKNPEHIVIGEGFADDVVQALGDSPIWNKTLFILNYDEGGGYYGHLPPPAALITSCEWSLQAITSMKGSRLYGFRVSAVVVPPYAERDHVSYLVYDHASVLAFPERKWNLPALTLRDANANDILDFLDLCELEKGPTFPVLPTLASPGNTIAALVCPTTGPGVIHPPESVSGG